MAFNLAKALAATERDDNLHIARLLLLLDAHSGKTSKPMEGLTKLAKLDFLLRYPNCLERALKAINKKEEEAHVKEFERTTIEAKMVRFRYGPWDHRYRRWVALMVAKGFVDVRPEGRTVNIWLTPDGRNIATTLTKTESYQDLMERANVVAKRFGSKSGTAIMKFVYETFPELTNMKWGEKISL